MNKKGLLKYTFLVLVCILFFTDASHAQTQKIDFSDKKPSWIKSQAELYFENRSFTDALPYYEYLYKQDSTDIDINTKLGITYLHIPGYETKALSILKKVNDKNSKKKNNNISLYLARAYHLNLQYDKAIELYKKSIENVDQEDTLYSYLNLLIAQCENGKKILLRDETSQYNTISVISILSKSINTPYYEYMPLVNADETKIIYTYRGPKSTGGRVNAFGEQDPYGNDFDEDIFYSEKANGEWTLAKPITELNTPKNDGAVALSPDGNTLIIYRNTEDSLGNLYITSNKSGSWSNPVPIPGFVNSEYWEGSACLNYNNSLLIFSSNRPGGYGGRDLYYSKKLPTGIWGKPINMGPNINSKYDEDAPFLFFDGKTLYYSTNGENSIGGYDIVYSTKINDSTWSKPVNVGLKINTPFDNKFYTIIADGRKAFYSSMRSDGVGMQDIYSITPGHFMDNNVFVLKGKTYLNYKVGQADISVTGAEDNAVEGSEHFSNDQTGKYLLVFPEGSNYKLTFSAPGGYRPYSFILPINKLNEFRDSVADIFLFTEDMFDKYMNISGIAYDSITGKPLAGVSVILSSTDGSYQMETITDENGYYIFRKVPKDKEYNIFVDYDGAAKVKGQVTDLYNQEGISGIMLNEKRTGSDGKYDLRAGNSSGTIADFPVDYLIPYSKKNAKKNALQLTVEDYQKILARYGNSTADGLVFRVQVGAYEKPKNFLKRKKKEFEEIDELEYKKYEDKLTRFTIGTYLTLLEAEKMKKIAQQKPPHDAFIAIFYKGQRMLFSKNFMESLNR
jgi:tetratricopeptide (TPR) repeat protein